MQAKIATLVLPATLAVASFVLVQACEAGDDGDDEMAEDGSGDTGGISGSACYDVTDMAACAAEQLCVWNSAVPGCEPACDIYQDQAACSAVDGCFWESSDGGYCFGPLA